MDIRKIISEIIKENFETINLDSLPKDVLKTLEDEYGHYYMYNFDFNEMQDKFTVNGEYNHKAFKEWEKRKIQKEFYENLNKLITKTREDLITIKRKNIAKKALDYFEKLIIPALGNEALTKPLSKFVETILLGSNDPKEISKAFQNAENIFDEYGNVDASKTTPSEIFVGGEISIPGFEKFVDNNPEYKGVYIDWKKLHDRYMETSMKELNAFRKSTKYTKIKELYKMLIQIKK